MTAAADLAVASRAAEPNLAAQASRWDRTGVATREFNPAYLTQGDRQPVLPWVGSEAPQHVRGGCMGGLDRDSEPQGIIPVGTQVNGIDCSASMFVSTSGTFWPRNA